MPGLDLLLPFLLTALLLAITPGPGLVYIAAQTVGRGREAGWHSVMGTHLGSYVHIFAAAFGLSLVLQAVPAAYLALKIIGAGYLFWLGLTFLLGREKVTEAPQGHVSARRALKDGFIVEATNPKSALFFLAILPQFTDPATAWPVWFQIAALGFLANLLFTLADMTCMLFASRISLFLRRSRAARDWSGRMAGALLIGLGGHLLASER